MYCIVASQTFVTAATWYGLVCAKPMEGKNYYVSFPEEAEESYSLFYNVFSNVIFYLLYYDIENYPRVIRTVIAVVEDWERD